LCSSCVTNSALAGWSSRISMPNALAISSLPLPRDSTSCEQPTCGSQWRRVAQTESDSASSCRGIIMSLCCAVPAPQRGVMKWVRWDRLRKTRKPPVNNSFPRILDWSRNGKCRAGTKATTPPDLGYVCRMHDQETAVVQDAGYNPLADGDVLDCRQGEDRLAGGVSDDSHVHVHPNQCAVLAHVAFLPGPSTGIRTTP
jgi:hypothetical protein